MQRGGLQVNDNNQAIDVANASCQRRCVVQISKSSRGRGGVGGGGFQDSMHRRRRTGVNNEGGRVREVGPQAQEQPSGWCALNRYLAGT